jgi:hypothetical protein
MPADQLFNPSPILRLRGHHCPRSIVQRQPSLLPTFRSSNAQSPHPHAAGRRQKTPGVSNACFSCSEPESASKLAQRDNFENPWGLHLA